MLLNCTDANELRVLLLSNASIPHAIPATSVPAAVELALTLREMVSSGGILPEGAHTWLQADHCLAQVFESTDPERAPQTAADRYSAAEFEASPIASPEAIAFFCKRFGKSLATFGGLHRDQVRGMEGALAEMADNVLAHGYESTEIRPRSVMAYHVDENGFSFAVGDLGRGIRSSLRCNPTWSNLATDQEALAAVVLDGASRRGTKGSGFATVVKAISDVGTLRVSSGSAYFHASGRPNDGPREGVRGTPPAPITGTIVSVE